MSTAKQVQRGNRTTVAELVALHTKPPALTPQEDTMTSQEAPWHPRNPPDTSESPLTPHEPP